MQWSYHLGSTILATTSKFKIAVEIGVFRLIHEALYFCSICNNLDSVHRIQTKFGMDILLDPRNKPAKEFFIFLKIQDGRRRSKIFNALYFFNFFIEPNFQHVFSLWRRQKSCKQVNLKKCRILSSFQNC